MDLVHGMETAIHSAMVMLLDLVPSTLLPLPYRDVAIPLLLMWTVLRALLLTLSWPQSSLASPRPWVARQGTLMGMGMATRLVTVTAAMAIIMGMDQGRTSKFSNIMYLTWY